MPRLSAVGISGLQAREDVKFNKMRGRYPLTALAQVSCTPEQVKDENPQASVPPVGHCFVPPAGHNDRQQVSQA